MKYEDEKIFDDEDIPQTLSKEYLLSRMSFLRDIGYTHRKQQITQFCTMHFVAISSLNFSKLIYPLLYKEVENNENYQRKNDIFNLKEVNDEYGHYFLIRGKFSYTAMIGTDQKTHHGLFRDYTIQKNIHQITGGHFIIGFKNNNQALIYSDNEFNEKQYLEDHKDIIFKQSCRGASIIYEGELDDLDKSLVG